MNLSTAHFFIRQARRWSVLLAGILLVAGAKADVPQSGRFLLVFETSPALKKNMTGVKATLDELFSSNLQHEMQDDDDLAVWTVDQDLHTGTFPLASWSPEDAAMYSERLQAFLHHQKFTHHATLAAMQPLLNRVVTTSERLTVLIFCDGQSSLTGTPYDGKVNEIFKKANAADKRGNGEFILVLRLYQGKYIGGSVNRMPGLLNIPKFPPPPAPERPPVAKPPPVAASTEIPVPALIIVGTNVGTNINTLTKPLPTPTPVPETKALIKTTPATNRELASMPSKSPVPNSNPPPVKPATELAPTILKNSTTEQVATTTLNAATPSPPAATNPTTVAIAATETPTDAGFQRLIFIGGGLLVAALGLVVWLATRSRRPRGSLISSSMQDDLRQPPRK